VSVALSGPDEDVGRAIVVTVAWGTARELLVTQTHLPKYTHLSFLSRKRMQRVQMWAEHVKRASRTAHSSASSDVGEPSIPTTILGCFGTLVPEL
jgi:hypothetical protein